MSISVITIAKDEERDIGGFIANAARFADEVVIVLDEATTDRTLGVIEEAGAAHPIDVRVVRRALEPVGGFAAQRNAGIDAASGEWLLHLDADMRVPREMADEIVGRTGGSAADAFRFGLIDHFLHRPRTARNAQTWNKPWLARRGKHRFERALHENVVFSEPEPVVEQLRHVVLHLNDESYDERVRKSVLYSSMRADALIESGRGIGIRHLILTPVLRAMRRYVVEGGFRDGTAGLIHAIHCYNATFRAYALAWDRQHHIPREALEGHIQEAWEGEGRTAPAAAEPVSA